MTSKKASRKPGSVWDLGSGEHTVIRPDGEAVRVSGPYVLQQPGTYRCDEQEVQVTP